MQNKISAKRIEFSPIFVKRFVSAPPEIQIAFKEALELFLEDPNSPTLRNHSLLENYVGVHSIDVTDDWRALYREERERVIFVELGTHQRLY